MLFPKGKTKFIRPNGSIGRAPGHGIVLLGMGEIANTALRRSQLGLFVELRAPVSFGNAKPTDRARFAPADGQFS
jgi:hypothetical protein